MITFPRLSKPRQKINLLIAALFAAVQMPLAVIATMTVNAAPPTNPPGQIEKEDKDPKPETKKVEICHRSNSTTNPYGPKKIEVSYNAVDGSMGSGENDHTSHNGPVFNPDQTYTPPMKDDDWGDIIPPYTYESGTFPGKNWTELGQVFWENNCQIPGSVEVNKEVDANNDGIYEENDNADANTIGFRWGLDGTTPARLMGTRVWATTKTHTVSENNITGYTFTGWYKTGSTQYSCANPEGTTQPINVVVVSDTTSSITLCNRSTSNNEAALGSITIVKDARPDNVQDFVFSATGLDGVTNFTLDDDGDNATVKNSVTYNNLEADEYSFTEQATTGWTLASINCTKEDAATVVTVAIPKVTINLAEGDEVTCTFVNTLNTQGVVLSDTDEVVTTGGQGGGAVLGAQTEAPVGGVAAGFGGATTGASLGSLAGLATSLSAVGYGVASLRKRQ